MYHFNTGVAGLAYLGVGLGFTVGSVVGGHYGNKMYRLVRFLFFSSFAGLMHTWAQLAARNGGQGKPEMRVPAILVGSLIIPIGLLYVSMFSRAEFGLMLTLHAIPWALP